MLGNGNWEFGMEDAIILPSSRVTALVMIIILSSMAGWSRRLVGGIVVLVLLLVVLQLLLRLVFVVHVVSGSSISGRSVSGRSVSHRSLQHSRLMILSGCSWGRGDQFVMNVAQGLAMNDSIEAVDGVGGVLHGATVAVGIVQGILSLHHVAVTGLNLAFGVAGDSVLHVVGEIVLGMGIIRIDLMSVGVGVDVMWLLVDHMLRLWHSGVVKLWLLVVLHGYEAS